MTATYVDDSRTYRIRNTDEGWEARNLITIKTGVTVTLAIDLSEILNPGTGASTFSAIAVTGTALTTSNLAVAGDSRLCHFDVANPTVAGERTLVATIATSDSQTLKVEMVLVVE